MVCPDRDMDEFVTKTIPFAFEVETALTKGWKETYPAYAAIDTYPRKSGFVADVLTNLHSAWHAETERVYWFLRVGCRVKYFAPQFAFVYSKIGRNKVFDFGQVQKLMGQFKPLHVLMTVCTLDETELASMEEKVEEHQHLYVKSLADKAQTHKVRGELSSCLQEFRRVLQIYVVVRRWKPAVLQV